ncbi:hypothetical protein N9D50_05945, partial [Flavobacteriaceae bacterium]|nr:hypothetical protein [Flavobacteriaceae bacterium]
YLALLGWNDGTENEFFSLKDLETRFSVTGIQKGGARFDYEKARWVNHHKIVEMNTEELTSQGQIAKLLENYPKEQHQPLVNLVKERLYTLKDLVEEIAFVEKTYPYDEKVLNKLKDKNPIVILNKIKETIEKELPNLKESLMNWAKEESIPMGTLMQSFRIALVGQLSGPDLFEICNVLGKEVSLIRIENLIQHINLKLT